MSRARILTPLTLSTSWQIVPISVPAKSVALQCRTAVDVLLCHHTDDIKYWTIKSGTVLTLDLEGQKYAETAEATNLISNGTFTTSSEPWTFDAAPWTYNANAMDKDADGTGVLSQPLSQFIPDHIYKVVTVMSGYTVSGLTVAIGGGEASSNMAADATFTHYLVAGRTATGLLVYTPLNAGRFTVDSIVVNHMPGPVLLAKVGAATPILEIIALM